MHQKPSVGRAPSEPGGQAHDNFPDPLAGLGEGSPEQGTDTTKREGNEGRKVPYRHFFFPTSSRGPKTKEANSVLYITLANSNGLLCFANNVVKLMPTCQYRHHCPPRLITAATLPYKMKSWWGPQYQYSSSARKQIDPLAHKWSCSNSDTLAISTVTEPETALKCPASSLSLWHMLTDDETNDVSSRMAA